MLGIEGAARQGAGATSSASVVARAASRAARTAQIKAGAPAKRNRRLREAKNSVPNSPDLGCARRPTIPLERKSGGTGPSRSVRRSWSAALAGCNWRLYSAQAPGDRERWVLLSSRGVNSSAASPRSQFARQRSCALLISWGSAPDFANLTRLRHGLPLRTHSPSCSTKWSADSPKRCSAQRIFQPKLKTPSRGGAPSSQKPTSQRCGSCERCSGLEVRRPDRSKICRPKSGPIFFRCCEPARARALSHGRRGYPASPLRKAVCAQFDNPSRSWDINPSTVPRLRPRVKREHGRPFS
jgi:hypothetical protein